MEIVNNGLCYYDCSVTDGRLLGSNLNWQVIKNFFIGIKKCRMFTDRKEFTDDIINGLLIDDKLDWQWITWRTKSGHFVSLTSTCKGGYSILIGTDKSKRFYPMIISLFSKARKQISEENTLYFKVNNALVSTDRSNKNIRNVTKADTWCVIRYGREPGYILKLTRNTRFDVLGEISGNIKIVRTKADRKTFLAQIVSDTSRRNYCIGNFDKRLGHSHALCVINNKKRMSN